MRLSFYDFCAESGKENLLREWDAELNGDLTPQAVSHGSTREIWWRCQKGHSWKSAVYARTAGKGCPYCGGRRVIPGFNDLASQNGALAAQWDAVKNAPLRPEEVDGRMDEFFSYKVPCLVICNGDPVPEMLMRKAKENGVPIFCCEESTSKTSHIVVDFLDNVLAPEEAIHANLLDVYNVGVMIRGESGMGKSELSLELIKRGHLLVADDMTVIRKVNSKRLVGYAPETTRNLIEIRGLGIMDVKQLYGMATVLERKSIDIVIDMEMWETGKMYDRLGFDRHYDTIMGVSVPHYVMPVRPGRNLAVVVEATAMDYRVKSAGFNIEEEINRRLETP